MKLNYLGRYILSRICSFLFEKTPSRRRAWVLQAASWRLRAGGVGGRPEVSAAEPGSWRPRRAGGAGPCRLPRPLWPGGRGGRAEASTSPLRTCRSTHRRQQMRGAIGRKGKPPPPGSRSQKRGHRRGVAPFPLLLGPGGRPPSEPPRWASPVGTGE